MKVYVDEHPQWLNWIAPEKFKDAELYKIVTFYVFQSPCQDLSARCKTLYEYGWSNPWSKPYYLNRQLKQRATNFELFYSASTHDGMDQALQRAHLDVFPPIDEDGNFDSTERLCFYDCKNNQSMSVFYHIRNMLAHCR